MSRVVKLTTVVLSIILTTAANLNAQQFEADAFSGSDGEIIRISLEEAIQIALVNNYMLRQGALDIDMADAQIREAWGAVYPQVNASGSYTRNIRTPNPFAGSDAGGLFEAFGALDWLAFNESARTDGDPDTEPIPFEEFLERQMEGYREAGVTPPGMADNPFAVENQFEFGVSVTQALYNGSAFAAIRGARQLRQINKDQLEADRLEIVKEIKNSFYGALLAQEQTKVLRNSVGRLERTVDETKKAVQAGILSKYDRVSAEVELVNLETNLIEAENQTELAVKNLALQLGIPVKYNMELKGALEFTDDVMPDMLEAREAYELAMRQRPEVNQADDFIDLLKVNRNITRSQYFPVVNAFANAAYIGQVPDNRTVVSPVQGQDFTFTTSRNSFFSDSYWSPAVAVGISMSWNIFNGFQTSSRMQQHTIDIRKAEIDREMLKNAVYLEVEQAIRNLETAYRRIMSQKRNIEQAEINYEFSLTRLREGVGTPLEERQASSLLDQSKLNYLNAVYDYLTALSRYEKAIGKPLQIND